MMTSFFASHEEIWNVSTKYSAVKQKCQSALPREGKTERYC